MFDRIAALTWTRPKTVLALVGVFVLIAGALGGQVEERLKPAGFSDPASESERAEELLLNTLGHDASPGLVIHFEAPDGQARLDLRDPAIAAELRRIERQLAGIEHVARTESPLRPGAKRLVAENGRSALITANLDVTDEELAADAAEEAQAKISSEVLPVRIGGFAATFNEVNDSVREDLVRAELIAFPILFILLLVVFRGLVAALIPLAIGGISIMGTFLGLRLMSEVTDTSIFALNIATALGLGLAVDYGLLMVSRYREEIERSGATREAHRRVVATAGRTVMYSGLTVAAAMAALVILPQRFLYSMGAGGAMVALLASAVAIITVPALLALLGERINALAIRRGPAVSDTSRGWYRLARGVMRRPIPVALASAGILLAAAIPVLSLETTGPSPETAPKGKESRYVTDRIAAGYPSDIERPIAVAVEGKVGNASLERLNRTISVVDGVEAANPFTRVAPDLALATFGPEGVALSSQAQGAVERIRNIDAPGKLLVSGNTASFIDLKASLVDNAPIVIALVTVTTLFLLFMLTGSVILPIKTLVMNGLTLAATVGIMVLAFQEELLHGLLDFSGPSALEASMLVVLFAVTFGLATDYAVLVMARIKELHDQGLSNEEAVAVGIGRTGRVITAAAMLLAVVFLAFTTSSIFFMKEVGVGQAVGVIIDASIVRALLVPSLMRLFGDWNWWAPRPLSRFQDRFGFREAPISQEA